MKCFKENINDLRLTFLYFKIVVVRNSIYYYNHLKRTAPYPTNQFPLIPFIIPTNIPPTPPPLPLHNSTRYTVICFPESVGKTVY